MEEEIISNYKLQLAHDLIVFLTNALLLGAPQDKKAEQSTLVLEAWEKRVNTKLKEVQAPLIKDMVNQEGIEEDVATILASISSIETDAIRKEFKVEAHHGILRSFNIKP